MVFTCIYHLFPILPLICCLICFSCALLIPLVGFTCVFSLFPLLYIDLCFCSLLSDRSLILCLCESMPESCIFPSSLPVFELLCFLPLELCSVFLSAWNVCVFSVEGNKSKYFLQPGLRLRSEEHTS